jgi:hypothetical protein
MEQNSDDGEKGRGWDTATQALQETVIVER